MRSYLFADISTKHVFGTFSSNCDGKFLIEIPGGFRSKTFRADAFCERLTPNRSKMSEFKIFKN